MKKLLLGSFIALTVALLGWGATDNVNAASPYDNFLNKSDVMTLDGFHSCNVNVENNWLILMMEETPHLYDNWDEIRDNGAWALSIDTENPSRGDIIGINYVLDKTQYDVKVFGSPSSNDAGFRIYNKTTGQPATSNSHGVYYSSLRVDNDCEVQVGTNNFSNGILNYRQGSIYKLANIFSNFDTLYPEDYEGDEFSEYSNATEVYPIMGITIKDAVDNLSDIFITASSRTWESRGLPPPDFTVITLEDSDNNIIITDGCLDAGRYCDYKKLPHGVYTAYLNIVYTDEDINDSYDFKTTKHVFEIHGKGYTIINHPDDDVYCSVMDGVEWNCDITQPDNPDKEVITGYGGPPDWYACVKPDFPFIDIEACAKNFNQIVNLLSFDTITFNNNWSTSGCHSLGTLGDWLNLENSARVICPQFSNSVRNIITPFITFFLATVTISFVARKTEGDL